MSRFLSPNHGPLDHIGLEKIQKIELNPPLNIIVKLSINLSGRNEYFPEISLRVPLKNMSIDRALVW